MQKVQSSDEKPALQNGELIENEAPASVTHQETPKKLTHFLNRLTSVLSVSRRGKYND